MKLLDSKNQILLDKILVSNGQT